MQIENINVSIVPNRWNVVCARCGTHLEVRLNNDNTIAVEPCPECFIGVEDFPIVPLPGLAACAYAGCSMFIDDDRYLDFDVILCDYKDNKTSVIKLLREETNGLLLKGAYDIVNSLPKTIAAGICKSNAEDLKKKFEALGCVVELKRY